MTPPQSSRWLRQRAQQCRMGWGQAQDCLYQPCLHATTCTSKYKSCPLLDTKSVPPPSRKQFVHKASQLKHPHSSQTGHFPRRTRHNHLIHTVLPRLFSPANSSQISRFMEAITSHATLKLHGPVKTTINLHYLASFPITPTSYAFIKDLLPSFTNGQRSYNTISSFISH